MVTAGNYCILAAPRHSSFLGGYQALPEFSFSCSRGSVTHEFRFLHHPECRQERESDTGSLLVVVYVTLNTLAMWFHQERFSQVQFHNCSNSGGHPFSLARVGLGICGCPFACHKTRRWLLARFEAVCIILMITHIHTNHKYNYKQNNILVTGENCHNNDIQRK